MSGHAFDRREIGEADRPARVDAPAAVPAARRLTSHQVLALQRSAGNQAVARRLSDGRPSQRRQIARDAGASLAVAGLVLSGVSIVQSQVNAANGGLAYSSDQITYPRDTPRADGLTHKAVPVAHFFSKGLFDDNDTLFKLHGEFSASDADPPVMANVYIDLARTTSYLASTLSFKAVAMQTAYGSAQDPRIRFVCSGRFDPAGTGDTSYRTVIEVDRRGAVTLVSQEIVSGAGYIQDMRPGFEVFSGTTPAGQALQTPDAG